MEAIKLCRLDTHIIFIEARINLSRFVVTGCAAKTSDTVSFPFFFSSRRRHTRCGRDWSSDVCSSDLMIRRPPRSTLFRSPLVWDVFAISTYLSISTIFFIVGLVPDIAALRDASTGWRRRIYGMLSLGWEGSDDQWRPYRRAHRPFAAPAPPPPLSPPTAVSSGFPRAL